MIVGGYTLDLYCDDRRTCTGEGTEQFGGETASECRRLARRDGWTFYDHMRKVRCPSCSAAASEAPDHGR